MADTTMTWRKSSFCSDSACVEIAFVGDEVAMRDSKKNDSAVLTFTRDEWEAFVRGVQANEFRPF